MTNEYNIDISKLTGDWRTWAENADKYGNNVSKRNDGRINSAFEADTMRNLARNAGKSDEEISAILSGDFSSLTPIASDKKMKQSIQKASIRDISQAFSSDAILENEAGINWNTIVSNIRQRYSNPDNSLNPEYSNDLADKMAEVATYMQKPFNSKEDIAGIYDSAKKDLKSKKDDEFKDFKLDVLEQFVAIAETFQQQKESKQISDKYQELRTSGKSRTEAIKEIEDLPEFKQSYFPDIIKSFKKNQLRQEARTEVWKAYDDQKGNVELTSYRKVKKSAKKQLKTQEIYDKYTRKVLRGERSAKEKLEMEQSTTKAKGTSVAIENNVMTKTQQEYTFDDLASVFKDNSNIPTFVSNGLINKNSDDQGNITFNITPLAEMIRSKLGADLVANRQKSDYRPYSEVANVVSQIYADTNRGASLSDKQVKKLIEMCGFKVEGKNWVKIAIQSAVDTVFPVAGMGAGVALSASSLTGSKVQDVTIPYEANVTLETLINQNFNFNLNLVLPDGSTVDAKKLYQSLLKQGIKPNDIKFSYDNTGNLTGIAFDIHTADKVTKDITVQGEAKDQVATNIKVDRDLLEVLLKQITFTYALNFLKNAFQNNQGELPVAVTQFETTDFEEYARIVDSKSELTSAQKITLKQLAKQFVTTDGKTTTWNAEGYKQLLIDLAGGPSFLNKNELAIGAFNLLNNPEKIASYVQSQKSYAAAQQAGNTEEGNDNQSDVTITQVTTTSKGDNDNQSSTIETKTNTDPDFSFTPKTVKYRSWADTVHGYDILKKEPYNKVVNGVELNTRMVKVIQAIDLSKANSSDDIKALYDIDTIANFAEEAIKNGIDAAITKYPILNINKDKYKALLRATAGLKGDVLIPDLYKKENGTYGDAIQWSKKDNVRIRRGGRTTTTVEAKTITKNGQTHYYKMDNGLWTEIQKDEYDRLQQQQ